RFPVSFGEFDFEAMIPLAPRMKRVQNISRFPFVERDLALVMNKHQAVEEVFEIVKKTANKHLHSIDVFDIYEGDNLE
ncbi:MAG: hypothetical protein KDD45_13080, partial [Bdellovibrionales bacterium]|nr:hypothetical protein [Bdellovibrionales bacterium]